MYVCKGNSIFHWNRHSKPFLRNRIEISLQKFIIYLCTNLKQQWGMLWKRRLQGSATIFSMMTFSIVTLSIIILCHYVEHHNAECHNAECQFFILNMIIAKCRYAKCHYAKCRYTECHNVDCRSANWAYMVGATTLSKKTFDITTLCMVR